MYAVRRGSMFPIHCAIRKYGVENFDLVTLHVYDNAAAAKDAEKDIIAGLDLMNTGYNATGGGDGVVPSDEVRAKMSAAARRRGPEAIEKMVAPLRGVKLSDAHRKALSQAASNRSPETRRRMGVAAKGRVVSAETKAKMSRAMADRVLSDEHKEKLRRARLATVALKREAAQTQEGGLSQ